MVRLRGEVWYWRRSFSSHGGREVYGIAGSLMAKMVAFREERKSSGETRRRVAKTLKPASLRALEALTESSFVMGFRGGNAPLEFECSVVEMAKKANITDTVM